MSQFLIAISMLFSIGIGSGVKKGALKPLEKQNVLKTGWYYISSQKTSCLRKLDQSNDEYYLNPEPIATAKEFTSVEIKDSSYGNFIMIKFNTAGTIAWSKATDRSIGKKLALVIGNKLVYTPQVNSQITSGISALNKGSYSDVQLQSFLKQIKSEM